VSAVRLSVRSLDRRAALGALAAIAVSVAVVLLTGLMRPPSADVPLGAVLSDRDRAEIAAVPVERGAPPPPADPAVDLADPAAVARAYLGAAHAAEPGDSGRTQRRAAAYAEPGSAAAIGVLVLDPPPPGSRRVATVTGLHLVDADTAGDRRGYRADLGTATGPPGGPVVIALLPVHIVLARQPGGQWLVTTESTDLPPITED
jgi:hypothetical protein